MNEDTHREAHHRLVDAWEYGLCAILFTCSLDVIEKIAVFLVPLFPDTERPLHTIVYFGLFSLVFALGLTASNIRRSDIKE